MLRLLWECQSSMAHTIRTKHSEGLGSTVSCRLWAHLWNPVLCLPFSLDKCQCCGDRVRGQASRHLLSSGSLADNPFWSGWWSSEGRTYVWNMLSHPCVCLVYGPCGCRQLALWRWVRRFSLCGLWVADLCTKGADVGGLCGPACMLSDPVEQERRVHCIDEVFCCPCSQRAKGTLLLTLLRDPYILPGGCRWADIASLWEGGSELQDCLRGSLDCLPRLHLLCQHGGGHAGAHTAYLDAADHVCPWVAAR